MWNCIFRQTVVDAYWKRLEDVKLGGPTYLAPVIQQIAAYAEKEVSQCFQHYTIGLVILDGIVNDLDNLIDKLVDVGNLPLSIVVVGVGPADFRLMVRSVSGLLTLFRPGGGGFITLRRLKLSPPNLANFPKNLLEIV